MRTVRNKADAGITHLLIQFAGSGRSDTMYPISHNLIHWIILCGVTCTIKCDYVYRRDMKVLFWVWELEMIQVVLIVITLCLLLWPIPDLGITCYGWPDSYWWCSLNDIWLVVDFYLFHRVFFFLPNPRLKSNSLTI